MQKSACQNGERRLYYTYMWRKVVESGGYGGQSGEQRINEHIELTAWIRQTFFDLSSIAEGMCNVHG